MFPALPDLTTQHYGSVCAGCCVPPDSCEGSARATSQLLWHLVGWDCAAQNVPELLFLGMIQQRHPSAGTIVEQMVGESVSVPAELNLVLGFEVPGWLEFARGVRPALRNVEEFEPGCQHIGWQHH